MNEGTNQAHSTNKMKKGGLINFCNLGKVELTVNTTLAANKCYGMIWYDKVKVLANSGLLTYS